MTNISGAGLGFRREIIEQLKVTDLSAFDFFEIAPENWIGIGGKYHSDLHSFALKKPFVCHGLSLSIGSSDPLDHKLLKNIKKFMDEFNIELYTEHLSWCSYNGHLYDLLPIPCTSEAVRWVSQRIQQTQEILERPIGIENASYYFSPPDSEMKEEEFIGEIVRESGCNLHLDVNNIFVNSQNFKFDPVAYLNALPLDKSVYIHVAGHFVEDDGLIIDTHGADVIDPVWNLLDAAYSAIGKDARTIPTCLERDFNFSDLNQLISEVEHIRNIQDKHRSHSVDCA